MKQNDIALVVVISFISIGVSILASNLVFNTSKDKKLEAEVVTVITPEFNQPDKKYFNTDSIDPTQIIRIGENANQQPFNQ